MNYENFLKTKRLILFLDNATKDYQEEFVINDSHGASAHVITQILKNQLDLRDELSNVKIELSKLKEGKK